MITTIFFIIQFIFCVVICIYIIDMVKSKKLNKGVVGKDAKRELHKLRALDSIRLTEPLSERTRPSTLKDIVGQQQGIKALRAAICGPNPQHVIIYGPPGVGKTAASRVILDEAKKVSICPFRQEAKFVELDATTLRFDERGMADPLLGSVHDPIYQGTGTYGIAGIPQPKMGAVTKAHGGILFIDEIGELNSRQFNALLKVLEDRRVFLESAYYTPGDKNIPMHIHEMFQKGLPADFRLIGATTRTADQLPLAIRSRCVEIYFDSLKNDEIVEIIKKVSDKVGMKISKESEQLIAKYAQNGRDAVNIVQIAHGIALLEDRKEIESTDVEWVIQFGHYNQRVDKKIVIGKEVGCVNGLVVIDGFGGELIDIEASAIKAYDSKGTVKVTGIIEQEELGTENYRYKRTSSAKASVDNALTVLKRILGINYNMYDIHLNFPGGIPIDGPSAGIAIVTAIYSAVKGIDIDSRFAMTGEVSITGRIKPVGGVTEKIEAARKAGVQKVIIPKENYRNIFSKMDIQVIGVQSICEVINAVF